MALFNKNKFVMNSNVYGKIYTPYYSLGYELPSVAPKLYNTFGDKMEVFFIRDSICAHAPYIYHSKFFIWDRYNFGLKTHFYTHQAMLETMGTPDNQYGIFVEPRSITPKDYKIFDKHKGLEKDFDTIFTFDEQLLNRLPNAKFFSYCACIWTEILPNNVYKYKSKDISIVCSNKKFTKHHKFRHQCAYMIKKCGLGDVFGQFDGSPRLEFKADSLKDYRYQVVIENGVFDYYFTEKIMDCFVSMTIPIYLGAKKIGEFFNMDGIITITEKDIDNISIILKQCNEKDYFDRLPAIKDNYARALEYQNLDDKLYETLLPFPDK